MGTWGHDAFSNDDSLDWLAELEETKGVGKVNRALSRAIFLRNASWLLFPVRKTRIFKGLILFFAQGSIVHVAGEVVAALGGHPSLDLPKSTSLWVNANRGDYRKKHAVRAHRALTFIRNKSETRILFDESHESRQWLSGIDDLLKRLLKLKKKRLIQIST
ncbi:DUF4259 domain-containing protein [Haloferula sargassicola]|uniref:DUF4259 domain-containing protein n=1 Tax=Haloferula sargassicola TaxID=490096 RepID=UPI0033655BE2